MNIAMGIRCHREAFGWSKSRLARELGAHPSSVYQWEKGRYNPSARNLFKLADVFWCSVDEIMGHENRPKRPSVTVTKDGCRRSPQ